jgi:serine/threonine protein kinase
MATKYEQLSVVRSTADWRVWRARNRESSERFLLKQVQPSSPSAEVLRRQLAEEYDFLRKFEHPGFLTARAWEDDGPIAAFEDMQGTLAQLIEQEGKLDADLVVNVLSQCARALAFLHGKKFGHGSVNTHTILIAPNGTVKFGDFMGFRIEKAAPRRPDERVRYLPPELISSAAGSFTPASDLYCLGFVALEMLTGKEFERLFTIDGTNRSTGVGDNWLGWHANPKTNLPSLRERLDTVQTALIDIISALVQKPANLRLFRTAEELAAKIDEIGLTSSRRLPPLRAEGKVVQAPGDKSRRARAQRLQLSIAREGGPPRLAEFDPGVPVVIGKQANCDLCLDDNSVSQKHAVLVCLGDTWWAFDLKSSTGTTVNNRRIVNGKIVRQGDEIKVGTVTCRVTFGAASPDRPPPGLTEFDNIRLVRRLHSGDGGDLYEGEIHFSKGPRPVAVRLFPASLSVQGEEVRRLARGALEAARFRHPNIVRVYRMGRLPPARKRWYLAMEHMSGGSLRDRVRQGPLTLADAVRLARDLVAALEAIEKQDVLHRNITPSCILFDKSGTAKLSDFLLMRGQELETAMEITRGAGTPVRDHVYQPPELFLNGEATRASDLYMVAASLYEALTGRPPFSVSLDLPGLMRAIEHDPVKPLREFNKSVPALVDMAILRALEKEPKDRFESPAAFLRALTS